jgi:hypothetical protein
MNVYIPVYTRTKKSSSRNQSDHFDRKPRENNVKIGAFEAPPNAIPSSVGMPLANSESFAVSCKCGWEGMDGELLCLSSSDILWCPKCRKSEWDFK